MKLSLFFLAALAWGQEASIWQTLANGKLHIEKAYLLWITDHDRTCYIKGMHGPTVVLDGLSQAECWNQAIKLHNESMSNPVAHRTMDEALEIMARAFGRHFKADAR